MDKRLHVISTGQQSQKEFICKVEMIHQEVDAIHLREKSWSANQLVDVIQYLNSVGVPLDKLIVNDRIDVAYIMGIGGVHLAYHSISISFVRAAFPTMQIGCSVHSLEEAVKAEAKGANYLLYGHIYETSSKQGIPPKGLKDLQYMNDQVSIPIIAIGGITPENTEEIIRNGGTGIAVMSGILLQDDLMKAVKSYRTILDKGGKQ
jgi:thiazole tautomerase (transcriptional regulator TenI)